MEIQRCIFPNEMLFAIAANLSGPSEFYAALQVSRIWNQCVLDALQHTCKKLFEKQLKELKNKFLNPPMLQITMIESMVEQIFGRSEELKPLMTLPQILSWTDNILPWICTTGEATKWLARYNETPAEKKESYLVDSVYNLMNKLYGDQKADGFTYSDFTSPLKCFCQECPDRALIEQLPVKLFEKGGLDCAIKFIYAASPNQEIMGGRFESLSWARFRASDWKSAYKLARKSALDSKWNLLTSLSLNAFLFNVPEWGRVFAKGLPQRHLRLLSVEIVAKNGNRAFAEEIAGRIECEEERANLLSHLRQQFD
jgi:hypothetical protein